MERASRFRRLHLEKGKTVTPRELIAEASPERMQAHYNGWTRLAFAIGACVRCGNTIPRDEVEIGGYCFDCATLIDTEETEGWDFDEDGEYIN